jgi:hypothetical protein
VKRESCSEATMRIESDDRKAFLELIVETAYCLLTQSGEDDDTWNATVQIQITTAWLNAKVDGVDLYRNDMDQFLIGLRELEVKRKGRTALVGRGYTSFELSIYNTNDRGYLGIDLSMEKYDLPAERHLMKALGSFDLDPSDLPKVLYGFEKLFDKQNLSREFGESLG